MKAKTCASPRLSNARSVLTLALGFALAAAVAGPPAPFPFPVYEVGPIGWVRKADGRTTIVLDDQYRPGLLGVDALESIWVLYWLVRNDTPALRSSISRMIPTSRRRA